MRLRLAAEADLEWIVALEWRPDMLAFIGGSDVDQHRAWLDDPDFRQVIVEDDRGERAGYALLNGYVSTPGVRLLRRIGMVAPERGLGRAALRGLIGQAIAEGVERFRLAVYDTNPRARHVYDRLGFVPEPGNDPSPVTRRDGVACRNIGLVLYSKDWRG